MSYVSISHKPSRQFGHFSDLFTRKWLQQVRARRELMSLLDLPDYLLKDIGLQRDDIADLAARGPWPAERRSDLRAMAR